MRTSDFERLKVFAAVAERGSFVKAAVALGMSTSSVSQSVRALEDRLALRLLNRTTRACALTEAGSDLLERVQPALEALDGALEAMNAFRAAPAGALKLSVSNLSLSMVVSPMLARFLAAHPAITVEVAIGEGADLGPGLDAGVREQGQIPQDMVAVRVGEPSRYVALASPAYLAAQGQPARPDDLLRHNCIRLRQGGAGIYPWIFQQDGRRRQVEATGSLVTDNGALMLSAAAEGAGIAYAIESYARPYVQAGRLTPLLQPYAMPFEGFCLYYPSRRHMPAPLRLFAEMLAAVARAPAAHAPPPRIAARKEGPLSVPAE